MKKNIQHMGILKVLVILMFFVMSINFSYAGYSLTAKDKNKVDKIANKIEIIISNKGENYRSLIKNKLTNILTNKKISKKNSAIISEIVNLISAKKLQIDENDFDFIFENTTNRCDNNPCLTTLDFIKIKGRIENSDINYVEVEDYRLKSFNGTTWEYNANIDYGNFHIGENTYNIKYYGENGDLIFENNFIINKQEVTIKNTEITNSSNDTSKYKPVSTSSPINYDSEKVKKYWLDLLNGVRESENLDLYSYDSTLDYTSMLWSEKALSRGYIDHKISVSDNYYDYTKKESWMKQNGVVCKNINRTTFSESIAWGLMYCSKDECTAEVKKTLKAAFDYFMAEKGKSYDPHYRAIINNYFSEIGLGITIQDNGSNNYKVFTTNHYCTKNIK